MVFMSAVASEVRAAKEPPSLRRGHEGGDYNIRIYRNIIVITFALFIFLFIPVFTLMLLVRLSRKIINWIFRDRSDKIE